MNKVKLTRILYHLTIVFVGFLTLALEIVASRMMGPYFGVTLDIWAAVLVVSLASLALGYYSGEFTAKKYDVAKMPSIYVRRAFLAGIFCVVGMLAFYPLVDALSSVSIGLGSAISAFVLLGPCFFCTASMTPILVRIESETSKQQLNADMGGKTIGHTGLILAESTLGSVFGALVCVYLLMPAMPLEIVVVYLLMPLFVVVSFLFIFHRRFIHGISHLLQVIMVVISGALFFSGVKADAKEIRLAGRNAVQKEVLRSGYGTVRVLDIPVEGMADWRYLLIDGRTQDVLTASGENIIAYTTAAANLLISYQGKKIKDVLVLGGGAGVIGRELSQAGIHVDIVDIIDDFDRLSHQYFFQDNNVQFYHSDARVFLNRCDKKYDAIIMDVFDGYGAPDHLMTREAFEAAKNCLTSGGVLSLNMLRDPENSVPDAIINATLSSVFPYVDLYTTFSTQMPIVNGMWVVSDQPIPTLELYNDNTSEFVKKDLKDNWSYLVPPKGGEVSTDTYPVYVYKSKELFRKEQELTKSIYGMDVMRP